MRNYKRQLKELLQITDEEAFDVVMPNTTEAMALAEIPALQSVYTAALDRRPEMKVYQNQLAQNDLNVKIAKAGKLPTIGLNAGLSTSTTSMNTNQNLLQLILSCYHLQFLSKRLPKPAVNLLQQ